MCKTNNIQTLGDDMEDNISTFLEAYAQTLSFIKKVLDVVLKKREKKEKQLDSLKQIIYNQRCLKYVCKGKYDKQFFIEYENKISDFLKTFFDKELSNIFVKGNINIYWSLRYGSSISDNIIEGSLEGFIQECNKRKFKVQ